MPLYEYQCKSCNAATDIRHGFDETNTRACACGGELVRKFHPAGIVFKGSGFYINDSRKPSSDSKSGDSAPAAKSGDAAPAAKSGDAAPAAASGDAAPAAKSGGAAPASKPEAKPDSSSASGKGETAA